MKSTSERLDHLWDSTGVTRVFPHGPYVLLIDDDKYATETFSSVLRLEQFRVDPAWNGLEALYAARRGSFDLLVIDLRLPDMLGLDVVRSLRNDGIEAPFIIVSGHVTVPAAVEAMQLGASTVLEKPVDLENLTVAVRAAVSNRPSLVEGVTRPREVAGLSRPGARQGKGGSSFTRAPSTARRWATLVLNVIDSASDPKTMQEWARAVNVSRSVICEYCRLVHVSPHDARDFARMMRAVAQSGSRWQPEAILDVADARMLSKLLRRFGLLGATAPPSLDDFLDRQRLIPQDNSGLAALRLLMSDVHNGSVSAHSSE